METVTFNRVIATSDLHLSDTIWKHRPIYGDSYHSWQYIVKYAIETKADAVILGGDLLDKQLNLANPIHQLLAGISELAACNIQVIFNQGQHEFQADVPWARLGNLNGNVFHLTDPKSQNKKFKLANGLAIVGFDYCNAKTLASRLEELACLSGQYFLVTHQVWKDFMGDLGNPQGSFEDIPANVRYLLTGDYHRHMCVKQGDRDLTVLSPGSSHMRSLSEPPDKYFFVLEAVKGKPTLSITSEKIPTRGYREFKTSEQSPIALESEIAAFVKNCEENLAVDLPQELKRPVVRITHKANENEIVNRISEKYGNAVHLFFKLEGLVVTNLADEKTVDVSKLTLAECLDGEVDKDKEPLTYELASRLLAGGDPSVVLETWLEEKLNAN